MLQAWRELDQQQRFIWNKLISGGFRVGVSQQLVTRALSDVGGIEPAIVAHRLMGEWEPSPTLFTRLLAEDPGDSDSSRPYPFFLAHALDEPVESLGALSEWQVEWKWDGIRCQLIRRNGQTFLWSRGEELVTKRYPEIAAVGDLLPDGTAIDGEILAWQGNHPLSFTQLQKRIGRKAVSRAILAKCLLSLWHMTFSSINRLISELGLGETPRHLGGSRRKSHHANSSNDTSASPVPNCRGVKLGRAHRDLERQPRCSGGRSYAQEVQLGLRGRPPSRRVVEMESTAVHNRRRPYCRSARER